jgi:TetR/AcrR family transcriptional regulator, regulator of cefoperazone and chloramphenicol sensitivity
VSRSTQPNPKQRILDAAITLFAGKGFNAVGVRELAAAADVNLSMINYYFGSKSGVLKAIIDCFFENYIRNAQEALTGDEPMDVKLGRMIRSQIGYFRKNPELMVIALTELPFSLPAVAEQKADYVRFLRDCISPMVKPIFGDAFGGNVPVEIIGPAVLGMIGMHFFFRPVIQRLENITLDDAFYERYIRTITHIFLNGLMSVSQMSGLPDQQQEVKQ